MYFLLFSLPESWENLIVAISSDGVEPMMDSVIHILLSKEMGGKTMNVGSQDAFHVQGRPKEIGPKVDKKKDK